jgi:integrase
MARLKLKHVDTFTDQTGRVRFYFRRGKGPRVVLPGLPGEAAFMAAYQKALDGGDTTSRAATQRGAPGTFDALLHLYFASSDYVRLASSTRRAYRLAMDRYVKDEGIGHRLVREMRREHVSRMVANRATTPGAANDLLKKLRILVRFAIDNGWRPDDPTLRIKSFAEGEWHTWTEDEIATFEARWPIGTRERRTFGLLLYTGQRLSDVARMSWRDLDGPGIQVVQGKTGAKLWIPLHPELAKILQATPREHVSILTTEWGKPFSAKGLGHWMAETIGQAGLPDRCVTHGLRKAAARRLAEAGCSVHQIMAITGHQSLKEIERYTKSADQRRNATAAMAKQLQGQEPNKNSQI